MRRFGPPFIFTGSLERNQFLLIVAVYCILVSKYWPNLSCFALQPTWEIADPILSLLGACVVLVSTLSVLRDSINILLEGKSKY